MANGRRRRPPPGFIERTVADHWPSDLPSILIALGYIGLYVLLDLLSYVQPVLKLGITPWNPQAGLTLAFLLTRPPHWAVAVAAAAFVAEVLVHDRPAAFSVLLAASIWIAIGYGVLAALLKRMGIPQPIESPASAARFALTALFMALLVAVGYVSIFAMDGVPPVDVVDESITRYWVGDLNGVFTLTPLLLAVGRWREALNRISAHRWLVLTQTIVVLLTVVLILGFMVSAD